MPLEIDHQVVIAKTVEDPRSSCCCHAARTVLQTGGLPGVDGDFFTTDDSEEDRECFEGGYGHSDRFGEILDRRASHGANDDQERSVDE